MRPEPWALRSALLGVVFFASPFKAMAADVPSPSGSTEPSSSRDSWPTFKGDNARTGRGPALRLPISVDWMVHLKGSLYSSPAIADGLVVLGSSDKRVYARDLISGVQRWERILPDRIWGSAPAIQDDRVYIGCVDACVYALSLTAGTVVHSYCAGPTSFSFFRSGD